MARSTPEWIGKTDDSAIPARVKVRVFDAHEGRCYKSGIKLTAGKWDMDHKVALCNGGENRESNLAPICKAEHRAKTRSDVAQKAKDARIRKKHLGLNKKPPQSKYKHSPSGKITNRETGEVIREAFGK